MSSYPSALSTKTAWTRAAFVRITDASLPQKRCLCNVGSWLRLRHSHRRPDDIREQSLTAPVIKTTVCSRCNEIIMTSQLTISARLCSYNILPHALVMYQSIPVGSGNPIHMSTGVNCHIQRCWLEACWLVSCMTCKDSFNGRAQYTDCKACCQFQQYYMTQILGAVKVLARSMIVQNDQTQL